MLLLAKLLTALMLVVGGLFSRKQSVAQQPAIEPFSLEAPVLKLSKNDPVTWRDLAAGTFIAGRPGSAKTTGSGATYACSLLSAGAGGLLHKIITSAPSTHAQVQDPEWQASSYCYQCILAADAKEKTPGELNDYELAATYFLNEFINFPPETRGSILATFSVCSDVFLRGTLGEIFGSETTNFCPEMSFEGAVIILDFPTRIYGQAGLLLQGAFKYCWQLAAERRDVKKNPRFAFMAIDEYQDIAAETDVAFFAVARSARICSLILTQSVAGLYAVFGGETGKHRTDQMLQALSTHIYHACAGETAKYASELIAKEFQMRLSYNSRQGKGGGGGHEHLEAKVLEAAFATLATGGPENNWIAEAICFSAGRIWNATGDTYLRTAFKQIL